MKRIAHYSPWFKIGGIETHIENLVMNMDGYNSTIITDGQDIIRNGKIGDSKIIGIGPKNIDTNLIIRHLPAKLSFSLNAPMALIRNINLCNYFKNSNYDVVHFHAIGLGAFLGCIWGWKTVNMNVMKKAFSSLCSAKTTLFTDHSIFLRLDTYPDWIEFYLDVFDNIVCVEKGGYENVVRWAKERGVEKKVWYIPNSVDTQVFKPFAPTEKTKNNFRIGWVGRFVAEKGEGFLLKLLKQLPNNLEIHLVYAGGESIDMRLKELSVQNPNIKLSHNLNYKEMPGFYNSIDLVLNTTIPIANDRVIPEAMSCGRPVIAFDKGSDDANYPIRDRENGFLIKRDINGILELLQYLNDNRTEIERTGRNARKSVEKELSNEIIIPQIKQVYETIMNK